jgi:hypothetical protein
MLWLWAPDSVPSSIITKLSAEGSLASHIKEVGQELK